jgi:signal transduction histidine kinase
MVGAVVMLRARVSRLSGHLLLAAGGVGLVGAGAWRADASSSAAMLVVVAALILAPAALWAYPEPRWRTPTDSVLAVCLVAPGLVALARPTAVGHVATMGLVTVTALVVQTWWRLEHSGGTDRRQLIWLALAGGVGALTAAALLFLEDGTRAPLAEVGIALLAVVPAAMAVGAARPEVVDVRALIGSTVAVAVVSTAFVAYYVGVVSVLSEVSGRPPSAGLQAVVALVGASSLHRVSVAIRGMIERLLFGDRPDSLRAAADALERPRSDPAATLEAVRESLLLPFARLTIDHQVVAEAGTLGHGLTAVPLLLADGTEGELVVGGRPGELKLDPREEQVLSLVGPLLAQTVRAQALAVDLQRSRGRAIATIAEERRRLRRDLHDGLGPALTGIGFSADAARNLVRTDPEAAEKLLVALRSDASQAVQEIRRLVYGMRPPALDELGLAGALRQQASSLRTRTGQPLQVEFDLTGVIPPMSAAVEVAAYRIATEALANVTRHSTGSVARVTLRTAADALVLEVSDDGISSGDWRPGIGTASMKERAAEVGGSLSAGASPKGGRVEAVLPLGSRTSPGQMSGGSLPRG